MAGHYYPSYNHSNLDAVVIKMCQGFIVAFLTYYVCLQSSIEQITKNYYTLKNIVSSYKIVERNYDPL